MRTHRSRNDSPPSRSRSARAFSRVVGSRHMDSPIAARLRVVLRVVAVALCIVCGVMVSYAGVRYLRGIYRADMAKRSWAELEARRQIASARAFASRQGPSDETGLGGVVGRLVIPRIAIDEVVLEGVED